MQAWGKSYFRNFFNLWSNSNDSRVISFIDLAPAVTILPDANIKKLQLPGKKVMTVSDFLNGNPGFFKNMTASD